MPIQTMFSWARAQEAVRETNSPLYNNLTAKQTTLLHLIVSSQ